MEGADESTELRGQGTKTMFSQVSDQLNFKLTTIAVRRKGLTRSFCKRDDVINCRTSLKDIAVTD